MNRSRSLVLLFLIIFAVLLFAACQNKGQSAGENPSDPSSSGSEAASPFSTDPDELTMSVFLYREYQAADTYLDAAALLYEERTGRNIVSR